MTFCVPDRFRVKEGRLASDESFGNNGAFALTLKHSQTAFAIASDGEGWEHVSVSRKDRCLTWDEMCQVKAMFWGADDAVMQIHPRQDDYVNNHPYCLHLWRPMEAAIPLPPSLMVGIREIGTRRAA